MLSFMREQGIETTKQGNEAAAGHVESPGAQPPATSQQYLTVSHKKQVGKSTRILAVLFCIGALVLWVMIKKSTPQTAAASAAGDNKIETLLAQFTGMRSEMFSNLGEISDRFYKFSNVQQVKNDQLIKNPFRIEATVGNFTQAPSPNPINYNVHSEPVSKKQEQTSDQMQLLSIMAEDGRKCCMINNRILYEGDLISNFKVLQIGDNFVKLQSPGTTNESNNKGDVKTELTLKLSE